MDPASPNNENGNMHIEVAYVFDHELAKELDKVHPIKKRAFVVHSLIEAYGLLRSVKTRVVQSKLATDEDLLSFHSRSYLEYLSSFDTNSPDEQGIAGETASSDEEEADNEYGIGYDCPSFKNMKHFVSRIVGGTLAAVEAILNGSAAIAINWCGGWHHAQRDEASGFCYANDIVIGIQKLQSAFAKILYVDLDAHHGDGVENAFSYSKKVFTLSIHSFEPGYFPGTGNVDDVGFGRGKYCSANLPLHSGINDDDFVHVVGQSLKIVMSKFKAEAVVVQCGADCLAGDPLGNSNLTEIGLGKSVGLILQYKLPTIFLGGGGYNMPNTAKCWTYLTSVIAGQSLRTDIPEHDYFELYGPDFDLRLTPSLRKNCNTPEYLASILKQLQENLNKLEIAQNVDVCGQDVAILYDTLDTAGRFAQFVAMESRGRYKVWYVHCPPPPPADIEGYVKWVDGVLLVRESGKEGSGRSHPFGACLRWLGEMPWLRIPHSTKTMVLNHVVTDLAGGRNKSLAAIAYAHFNEELKNRSSGLQIIYPKTIANVREAGVDQAIASMGGYAAVKASHVQHGLGVYLIQGIEDPMVAQFHADNHKNDNFIVQELVKFAPCLHRGKVLVFHRPRLHHYCFESRVKFHCGVHLRLDRVVRFVPSLVKGNAP